MTVRDQTTVKNEGLGFEDEFGPFLENAKTDPEFLAAFEDAAHVARIMDSLVWHRRASKISQSEVARRMGVRQPTVSQFENEGADPRISSIHRYARAVGARLRLIVEVPRSCDWLPTSRITYKGTASVGEIRVNSGSSLSADWLSERSARDRTRSA